MIQLRQSTGMAHIDGVLSEYLAQLAEVFSDRLRSIYLVGSAANRTTDHLSDVDGLVILAGVPSDEDNQTFSSVTSEWSTRSNTVLDFGLLGDEALFARGALAKKAASWVLIYGEEVRDRVPPLTVAQYTDAIMRGSFSCLKHTRGSPGALPFPLTYPDPDGEFFGYERRGYRDFHGWRSSGTKALVNTLSLAATTLVAIRTGFCAISRRESFVAYRERIGGTWAPFLDTIHTQCRDQWAYRLPDDAESRHQLRKLCHDVLAFENEYVLACIQYLRSRADFSGSAEAICAAETLGQIDYDPDALPPSD